jgi:hypothetical protein
MKKNKGTPQMTSIPYANLSELRPGDNLIADIGFNCLRPGFVCKVFAEGDQLYITCAKGRHWLTEQLDGDTLVGFWLQEEKPKTQNPSNQGPQS